MTYEPQLDAAPPTPAQQAQADPFYDLRIASKNYWAGRTGREEPPAPTFRMVRGEKLIDQNTTKKTLGRYMDPYGCQALLQSVKMRWDKWYTVFFLSLVPGIAFGPETTGGSIIALFVIFAPYYFWRKAQHRRQYNLYYAAQEEMLRTGEPVWVAYDKQRLQLIDRNPLGVWP